MSELLTERGLSVDASCICRWVQAYASEFSKRALTLPEPTNFIQAVLKGIGNRKVRRAWSCLPMPRHSATRWRLDSRLICVGSAPHRKVLLATALDFGDPFGQLEYRETEGEAHYKRGAPNAGKASLQRMEIACTFHRGRANGLNSMRNQQEFVIGGYTQPKGTLQDTASGSERCLWVTTTREG